LLSRGWACVVAEHVLGQLPRHLVLFACKCFDHRLAHLDVALAAIGLGVFVFAEHEGLAHQDQRTLEIDVLPLQTMDLACAHAGQEAHHEVVACSPPAR
jgi:hypothetical protein